MYFKGSMLTQFNSYVYRLDFNRLPACTSQVHLLLHLVDQIKNAGPARCYWTFPIERLCSEVVGRLESRKVEIRCPQNLEHAMVMANKFDKFSLIKLAIYQPVQDSITTTQSLFLVRII